MEMNKYKFFKVLENWRNVCYYIMHIENPLQKAKYVVFTKV